jgi:hypothetical protein
MTVRENQGHLRELYAVDVSPDLSSRVGVHWNLASSGEPHMRSSPSSSRTACRLNRRRSTLHGAFAHTLSDTLPKFVPVLVVQPSPKQGKRRPSAAARYRAARRFPSPPPPCRRLIQASIGPCRSVTGRTTSPLRPTSVPHRQNSEGIDAGPPSVPAPAPSPPPSVPCSSQGIRSLVQCPAAAWRSRLQDCRHRPQTAPHTCETKPCQLCDFLTQ